MWYRKEKHWGLSATKYYKNYQVQPRNWNCQEIEERQWTGRVCDSWDATECICEGACSCHWKDKD